MRHAGLGVLIVDDSATIRKNLARIFAESEEIEVVGEAADARQGLELARTLHPDLVTLDLRMPGGSGLNVIKQIKQLEPSPIVVVLTNYAHAAYRRRATEAGADFFFDKSSEFNKALDVFRYGGTQRDDYPGKQER